MQKPNRTHQKRSDHRKKGTVICKKWIQATDFLAAALSCSPKTPLDQAKLDCIVGMELYECIVQVWASKTIRRFTADITVLQQPQPFERLQSLHIYNADQSIATEQ